MFVEYKENIYEDIEIESFVWALRQEGAITDDEYTWKEAEEVQVNNHAAIRKLVDMVRVDVTITDERRNNILVGWEAAETLHRYSYGDMRIDSVDFDLLVISTLKFCYYFPYINKEIIRTSIDNLIRHRQLTLIPQANGYYQVEIYYGN